MTYSMTRFKATGIEAIPRTLLTIGIAVRFSIGKSKALKGPQLFEERCLYRKVYGHLLSSTYSLLPNKNTVLLFGRRQNGVFSVVITH